MINFINNEQGIQSAFETVTQGKTKINVIILK